MLELTRGTYLDVGAYSTTGGSTVVGILALLQFTVKHCFAHINKRGKHACSVSCEHVGSLT